MKKVIFLLIALAILFVATPALAHFWEFSEGTTVLMHIVPDDDPVIGKPAQLFFGFTNIVHPVKASDYDFFISIAKEHETLLQTQLVLVNDAKPSLFTHQASWIFSEKGIYTITIHGTPRIKGTLKEFNVTYNLRVDRQENAPPDKTRSHWFHVIVVVTSIVILIMLLYIKKQLKLKNQ